VGRAQVGVHGAGLNGAGLSSLNNKPELMAIEGLNQKTA